MAHTVCADQSTLILIDLQERLMPMIDRGAAVLQEALFLGHTAQILGVPIIGTEQNPRGLGPNSQEIQALCVDTLSKMHFDACKDGLLNHIQPARKQVVLAGCEAHVCLLQTAMGLISASFEVFVVAQACGSRSAMDHALAMQRLGLAGAKIISPEMLVFEWLDSCEHQRFKDVLNTIKRRPSGGFA